MKLGIATTETEILAVEDNTVKMVALQQIDL